MLNMNFYENFMAVIKCIFPFMIYFNTVSKLWLYAYYNNKISNDYINVNNLFKIYSSYTKGSRFGEKRKN